MDEELLNLLRRFVFPEKYAGDFDHWFHGDGPAEVYWAELEREGHELFERLGIEP